MESFCDTCLCPNQLPTTCICPVVKFCLTSSCDHYSKVKVESAEGQLPDFDLGRKVGRKIFLQKDRRAVVLCVVDVWDFDGSLPKLALQ